MSNKVYISLDTNVVHHLGRNPEPSWLHTFEEMKEAGVHFVLSHVASLEIEKHIFYKSMSVAKYTEGLSRLRRIISTDWPVSPGFQDVLSIIKTETREVSLEKIKQKSFIDFDRISSHRGMMYFDGRPEEIIKSEFFDDNLEQDLLELDRMSRAQEGHLFYDLKSIEPINEGAQKILEIKSAWSELISSIKKIPYDALGGGFIQIKRFLVEYFNRSLSSNQHPAPSSYIDLPLSILAMRLFQHHKADGSYDVDTDTAKNDGPDFLFSWDVAMPAYLCTSDNAFRKVAASTNSYQRSWVKRPGDICKLWLSERLLPLVIHDK